MRNYKFYLILFSLIVASTLMSCSKENIQDETQRSEEPASLRSLEGISFNGKWLVFQTLEDFQNKLDDLILAEENGNDSEFISFEGDFSGFNSIRSSNSALLSNEDMSVDDLISQNYLYTPSTAFGTLVSENGLIQVGDSIFYYTTGDSSYIIPAAHSNYLFNNNTYNLANLAGIEGFVSSFGFAGKKDLDNTGTVIVNRGSSGNIGGNGNDIDLCDYSDNPNELPNVLEPGHWVKHIYKDDNDNPFPKYDGGEVRFQLEVNVQFYLLYSYIGVKTKIQNKNKKGKWKNQVKADKLSIEACAHGAWVSLLCPKTLWANQVEKSVDDKKNTSKKLDTFISIVPNCYNLPLIYNINAIYKGEYKGATFDYLLKF